MKHYHLIFLMVIPLSFNSLAETEYMKQYKAENARGQHELWHRFEITDLYTRLLPIAEQGDREAQYTVGYLLKSSFQGVRQDAAEGYKWFRLSAEQGHSEAQAKVGYAYLQGGVVKKDYAEAAKWYRLASDGGQVLAPFFLGEIYARGSGVLQDFTEAAVWYRKGAVLGSSAAQDRLGDSYQNGFGVEIDYVKAHAWYNIAATNGWYESADKRAALAKKMSGAQITEAHKTAKECLQSKYKKC